MMLTFETVIDLLWFSLGVLWTIGMLTTKKTRESQAVGARVLHLLLTLPGFALLFSHHLDIAWLGQRFLPATIPVSATGVAVTIAGCFFAGWARIALGSNWSGRVTLKENHELVTSGPYSLSRNPIYTGLIVAAVGTAITFRLLRCIFGVASILGGFLLKIRQEEGVMMQAFPKAYPAYRKRVKALIPGIL